MAAAAPHNSFQSCADAGCCQGRKIPCLTCTRPDAAPWPSAQGDTFTIGEQLLCPVAVAAAIGFVIGLVYGFARYINPAWFNPTALLEYSGTLIHAAEARTRLLDGDTHHVPIVCMDIALDNSLHNVMHIEQPFPADHHAQAHARAHSLKKGMHVTVQVPPFDLRLVARNASHIHVTHQPQETAAPCHP